ncbi:hypothetical protein N1030_13150 [Desulfovibrio mangrovi]|uniref:hypothetical protein n=1 Tax=Desulfovibrio mangrovi TaxID=2976983 RepID=UPI00224830E2|nr:hypothetical protein [Desulfovibrio mangrovi]UZP66549.1 hypothetical protein N1030_13150 [Desulfovibrio mangrovi]
MPLVVEVNSDVFIVEKHMEEGGHELDVYGKVLFAEDEENDIILFFPQCDKATYERIKVGEGYTVRGLASIFAEEGGLISIQYLEPEVHRMDVLALSSEDRRELSDEISRMRAKFLEGMEEGAVTQ